MIFKLLGVLFRVYEQSNIDVYIVDFEHHHADTRSVNAWRQFFVANEFNELQIELRYVEPETMFIWFLFFWKALGWKFIT